MSIKKHLLKTSATLMTLVTISGASSIPEVESGAESETLVTDEMTRIDKYVFRGDTVYFENPCYKAKKKIEKKLGLETVKAVELTNGSTLNFTAKGGSGNVIRAFSKFSKASNPFGVSHSGFVVNLDPRKIYHTVLDIMPGGKSHTDSSLTAKAGRAILHELEEAHSSVISAVNFPEVRASFAIESYGSPGEVLRGIAPHVRIRDLSNRVSEYKGNIFVRPLYDSISSEVTMDFMKEYIGRPYENISTLSEMLNSVTESNTEERVENVFCSELVSLFYKKGKLLDDDIMANNVIPSLLSSGAEDNDLLENKALDDIPLKLYFSCYHPEEKKYNTSISRLLYQLLLKTFMCCCPPDNGK